MSRLSDWFVIDDVAGHELPFSVSAGHYTVTGKAADRAFPATLSA